MRQIVQFSVWSNEFYQFLVIHPEYTKSASWILKMHWNQWHWLRKSNYTVPYRFSAVSVSVVWPNIAASDVGQHCTKALTLVIIGQHSAGYVWWFSSDVLMSDTARTALIRNWHVTDKWESTVTTSVRHDGEGNRHAIASLCWERPKNDFGKTSLNWYRLVCWILILTVNIRVCNM
jgi:hypothetical protein